MQALCGPPPGAVGQPTLELVFNPGPSARLSAGTTLIVMGERSDIDRAKSDF